MEDGTFYVGHIRSSSDSRPLVVASGHSRVQHLASVSLAPYDRRGQRGYEITQILADGKLSHAGSARLGSDSNDLNPTAVVKQEVDRPPAPMTPLEAAFEGNPSSLDDWAAHVRGRKDAGQQPDIKPKTSDQPLKSECSGRPEANLAVCPVKGERSTTCQAVGFSTSSDLRIIDATAADGRCLTPVAVRDALRRLEQEEAGLPILVDLTDDLDGPRPAAPRNSPCGERIQRTSESEDVDIIDLTI